MVCVCLYQGCTVPVRSGPFQNWPVPERSGSYEFKKLYVPEDLFHSGPELQLQLQLQLQLYVHLQLQLQHATAAAAAAVAGCPSPVQSGPFQSAVRSVSINAVPLPIGVPCQKIVSVPRKAANQRSGPGPVHP